MIVWIFTIILVFLATAGWLFLKRDPQRYIHEKSSPINFFFKWGRFYHHLFKIGIIALVMVVLFSFYLYSLGATVIFSVLVSLAGGIILAGGKELLDKAITIDDIIASILGIILGLLVIFIILT
jgi:hypothetical protein